MKQPFYWMEKQLKEPEKEKRKKIKRKVIELIPLAVFLAAAIALTIIFFPEISRLGTEEGRAELKMFFDSLGFFGWLFGVGIVLFQTLVAFIPGEPVELFLGFAFGPWIGTAICLLGNLIGAVLIYFFVKKLGKPYVMKLVGDKDFTKLKFLENERRIELFALILFVIPGTPKDALLYIFPFTSIGRIRYFLISTFARIPSIVTSTVLGGSISEGNYVMAIIVFVITVIISLAGIIIGNKITEGKQSFCENEDRSSRKIADGRATDK